MALIKCPECGNMVSDYSKQCIHCGFPLDDHQIDKKNTCPYCGKNNFKASKDGENFGGCCDACVDEIYKIIRTEERGSCNNCGGYSAQIKEFPTYITCYCHKCASSRIILRRNPVTKIFTDLHFDEKDKAHPVQFAPAKHQVRCPKCRSTQITAGQRGYSLVWGFVGSNKTTNRCANCGYSWQPKR